MDIVFDPAKDKANRAKHGISLARAADLEMKAVIEDERFEYGEVRYRAFGLIGSVAYCLAFTVRGLTVRAISLRRAKQKEIRLHVGQEKES
jgi:uncharacterized DUF497 family protein